MYRVALSTKFKADDEKSTSAFVYRIVAPIGQPISRSMWDMAKPSQAIFSNFILYACQTSAEINFYYFKFGVTSYLLTFLRFANLLEWDESLLWGDW